MIPKQARELYDIKPGDTLLLLCDEVLGIAIPPKKSFSNMFATVFGQEESEE